MTLVGVLAAGYFVFWGCGGPTRVVRPPTPLGKGQVGQVGLSLEGGANATGQFKTGWNISGTGGTAPKRPDKDADYAEGFFSEFGVVAGNEALSLEDFKTKAKPSVQLMGRVGWLIANRVSLTVDGRLLFGDQPFTLGIGLGARLVDKLWLYTTPFGLFKPDNSGSGESVMPSYAVPLGLHWMFDTGIGELGLAVEGRYTYDKFELGEDGDGPSESDRVNNDHDFTALLGIFLRL